MKIYRMLLVFLLMALLISCGTKKEVNTEETHKMDTDAGTVQEEIIISDNNEISEAEKIEQADFSAYKLEAKYGELTYVLEVPVDDWHHKIYQVNDDKKEVYDLAKDDITEQMSFQKAPNRMIVSDEDGDSLEEIYLFFEDAFGSSWVLVLNQSFTSIESENILNTVYYGLSEDIPEYLSISNNDKPELLTNHAGGGGYVSVWEGLTLVNYFYQDINKYVYSYKMSKKYYEDAQYVAEKNIIENPVEESYVKLLKNLAHQGKISDCERIIKELKKANLILKPDWKEPYDTYYEYILAQASYYEDIWLQIKGWDMKLEESLSVGENIPSVIPLTRADLDLGNGLYLGMSYDDFCYKFSCNKTLTFNVDVDGHSTGQAHIKMNKIDLVFEWSPENTSSPLLIEYAVRDELLKTNKGIGLGADSSLLIDSYGKPDVIGCDNVIYTVEDTQLVFEFKDNRVIKYRVDNGTGLLD